MQVNSSEGYFTNGNLENPKKSFSYKAKEYWSNFLYYLRQVWPWIYRLINFIVYEIIKVVRAIVRIALTQVGLIKE